MARTAAFSVCARHATSVVRLGLPHDVHFPVTPLHGAQFAFYIVDEAFALRFGRGICEEVELIDAVDRPIVGHVSATEWRKVVKAGNVKGD